jgi:large subunit ribosomal protein L5
VAKKEQKNNAEEPQAQAEAAEAPQEAGEAQAPREPREAREARTPVAAASGRGADGRKNGKGGGQPREPREPREAYVPRLKEKYLKEVAPALMKEFGYSNPMETPQVRKVVINIGMGSEARENAKALDNAVGDIGIITGQKAVITRAKKSIASFKLRTGMPIGVMVTLRSNRMYEFLDKLVNVALPRVRDFSGVSASSFDGHGNFSLGLREQLIFPEIDYDKIDRIRGMEVVIVTSAENDQEGRRLLELIGMPFKRQG